MASPADKDSATPSGPPPMRASDADRLATVQVVQNAVARGLLTPDEGSQRMAAAFAAVHLHELGALTADLPRAPSEPSPPGWSTLATLAVVQLRSSLKDASTGRLHPARVAVALLVAVLLLVAVGSLTADLLFDDFGGGHEGFDHDD